MKSMRKLFVLLTIITMFVSIALPAYAANITSEEHVCSSHGASADAKVTINSIHDNTRLLFSSATCNHSFAPATCTTPRRCSRCSAVSGSALGHNYAAAATCTTPLRCMRCAATTGTALGHNPTTRSCTQPSVCTRCGTVISPALGHNWYATGNITRCSRCAITLG